MNEIKSRGLLNKAYEAVNAMETELDELLAALREIRSKASMLKSGLYPETVALAEDIVEIVDSVVTPAPCELAPDGWVCSMEDGHDGECVEDLEQ